MTVTAIDSIKHELSFQRLAVIGWRPPGKDTSMAAALAGQWTPPAMVKVD
jgi:hypothetical protein